VKLTTAATSVFQSKQIYLKLNCVFLVGIQRGASEIESLLASGGFAATRFARGADFLAADHEDRIGCLVVEQSTADSLADEVRAHAQAAGARLATIVMANGEQVRLAVQALRAGVYDVLQTPVAPERVLDTVRSALVDLEGRPAFAQTLERLAARRALAALTDRQRDILERIVEGQSNKIIAADMGVSRRTVENHRAAIMKRLGVSSASTMIQTTLAAR
jgi:FixJ family two-component response regulator